MAQTGTRSCEVELTFTARTYDIDYAGIVSNIVYIRWLEDLRLAMLEHYLPLEDELAAGVTPILLSTHIEYRRALRLFDRPVGRMWLSEVGKVRWKLNAEIVLDGTVSATAEQYCAHVSLSTLQPQRAPRKLRELLTSR